MRKILASNSSVDSDALEFLFWLLEKPHATYLQLSKLVQGIITRGFFLHTQASFCAQTEVCFY